MIADDLGFGDLSILGNQTLATPRIDSIGHRGSVLGHHLAAASVCTPSRSAFLTGRYPIRNGMTSPGKNRVFLFVASSGGLPENETTIAQRLKQSPWNYSTALVGKWHLGKDCQHLDDNCHHPTAHGFDYFFGLTLTNLKDFGDDGDSVVLAHYPRFYLLLVCIGLLGTVLGLMIIVRFKRRHWIWLSYLIMMVSIMVPGSVILFQRNIKTINSILYRNYAIVEQPIRLKGLTERLVGEASAFIRNATDRGDPFFLMVNFVKVHTAHAPSDHFEGSSGHGKYGDCVLELDYAVGKLLDVLEQRSILNRTMVYFSSDNGAHLEEVSRDGQPEGGSNGIFRGGKGHGAMEGGIRVPAMVMWPTVFPANQTVMAPTTQMDLFATIHSVMNESLPEDRIIDGKDLLPLLRGDQNDSPHRFVFHYCGIYLHAVRYIQTEHIWKVYFYTPKYKSTGEDKCDFVCMCYGDHVIRHDPPLIYDIGQDPGETTPISPDHPKFPAIWTAVREATDAHRTSLKPAPSQFSFAKTIWKPWLQPCCSFSNFCKC